MPVVTALRATKRGRIGLHVDGRFVCVVGEALIARHHLFQGKELDHEEFDALREEAMGDKAMADAHRLLAHRSRSRQELQRRLAEKGHDAQTIARAMSALEGQGLMDDAAFASAFVSDKRRLGGWGDQRIARELGALGVPGPQIDAALGPRDAERDLARAVALLRRQGAAPAAGDDAARRRAFQALRRRGFDTSIAYQALRAWSQGAGTADEP
jgi:regulatory protein